MSFDNIKKRIKDAVKILELDPILVNVLLEPNKVIEVELEVETSYGKEYFTAYRVQFENMRGPYKGGIRFHQNTNLDEMLSLAANMSIKNCIAGIPFGGAKGGVSLDPKKYTSEDMEKISRSFVQKMFPYMGTDKDIFAPDLYTNEQIMSWMLDEYEKIADKNVPGVITGKPILLGGSLGRKEATAQGGFYILHKYLAHIEGFQNPKKIIIQGFGKVGYNIAKLLYDAGHSIVAVSDSSGGVYDPKGFDPSRVLANKNTGKKLGDGLKLNSVSNEDLLTLSCDVLILASLDNQVKANNANEVKAKIILEIANNSISPEAEIIFDRKGVIVIPDVLVSSGGSIVSYFEWVQNRQQYYWTFDEVQERLEKMVTKTLEEVFVFQKKYIVNLRDASYLFAVSKLAEIARLRGKK